MHLQRNKVEKNSENEVFKETPRANNGCLFPRMSRLILRTAQLQDFAAESTNELRRCRVIAQFSGLVESRDNPTPTTLQFRDLKQLSEHEPGPPIYMVIGDSLYCSKFLNNYNERPIEGDVLDMRCCVVQGTIEIMHFRVLALKELNAITQFLNSDEGHLFLNMSGRAAS